MLPRDFPIGDDDFTLVAAADGYRSMDHPALSIQWPALCKEYRERFAAARHDCFHRYNTKVRRYTRHPGFSPANRHCTIRPGSLPKRKPTYDRGWREDHTQATRGGR